MSGDPTRRVAALVLCGGRSRRMGHDKAALPFGPETMLERVVRIVTPVVDEVCVVAREGQAIRIEAPIARDPAEGLGPLAALSCGLRAVTAERAFVITCDAPLLRPEFVRRMLELSAGHECTVPEIDGHRMVLAAVYLTRLHTRAQRLIERGERRAAALHEASLTRLVTRDELRDCDPALDSLIGCNSADEHRAALARAGLGGAAAR